MVFPANDLFIMEPAPLPLYSFGPSLVARLVEAKLNSRQQRVGHIS